MKIRISIIYLHLRSKLSLEMCPKIGGLNVKLEKNCLKVQLCQLFFFQKNVVFIEKYKTQLSILCSENKCTYKFYIFTIKSALGNTSERSEFRFENSLKEIHPIKKIQSIHL